MADYPYDQIIRRAREGREAIYPYADDTGKFSAFGTNITSSCTQFPTLDDIAVVAPQFTPGRLEKSYELIFREPFFKDVETVSVIGGFNTKFPLVQASMGSPDDWNKVSVYSAEACARLGIIYGIGENVAATWGYEKRKDSKQPSFIERVLTYLENLKDGYGGVIIQQNEEDAQNELWNRVYTDPRLTKYLHNGLIGFEIKGGQGAKAGIGGEKIVDRNTAIRLKHKGYLIHPDPEEIIQDTYERHSSPDIFTQEILKNRIKKLKNDYPRAKIWFKTGPYRDLLEVIKVASEAGIDAITIDGKEGGTGMSPTVALQHLGLPTISCMQAIAEAKQSGISTSLIISGRLYDGSHVVKSLALGADAVAMGRPFLFAAYAYPFADKFIGKELYKNKILKFLVNLFYPIGNKSIDYITNFVNTIKLETQLLTSSLGKYDICDITKADIITTKKELCDAFNIDHILSGSFYPSSDQLEEVKKFT